MPKKEQPLTGPMADISRACGNLAQQKSTVELLLAKIRKEQLAVTRKYSDELRTEVGHLSMLKGVVHGLVMGARNLFLKPKSRAFDGVVVGFEKERDEVSYPDASVLIANIRKLFPEKAALLIHTPPEAVRMNALKDLTAEEKQKLGIRTTLGADHAIVRLEKSDVEIQAAALLEAFEVKPEVTNA